MNKAHSNHNLKPKVSFCKLDNFKKRFIKLKINLKKPFASFEIKIHRLSFITISLFRHNTRNNAFFLNHSVP